MQLQDFQNRSRLPTLDGIRAVALFLVMVSHYLDVPGGRMALNAFFALSGFLITWLLVLEYQRDNTVSLSAFVTRRIFRIFPAYYAFLIVIFTVEYLQRTPDLEKFLAPTFFYYLNYFVAVTDNKLPEIQHLWSLSVEEQFYLFWPVTFLFLMRLGLNRALAWVAIAIVAVFAWRSFAWLVLGFEEKYVYRALDTRIDSILVGCLLALGLQHPNWREWLWGLTRHAFMIVPVVAALAISIWGTVTNGDYGYTLGFTIDGLLLCYLLLHCLRHSDHWSVSWLDLKWMAFIGAISYPVYLYHELAAGIATKGTHLILALTGIELGEQTLLYTIALASACGALTAGYLSYRLVEQPMMRLRDRVIRDRAKAPTPRGA